MMYQADEKRYETMQYNRCGKVGYYYQKFRWDFGITLDQMVIMII